MAKSRSDAYIAKLTKRASAKARTYDDDQRVNFPAVFRDYGITLSQFHLRQKRKSWPGLRGEVLATEDRFPEALRGRPEKTVLRSELTSAMASPFPLKVEGGEWLSEQTFRADGKNYSTIPQASDRTKIRKQKIWAATQAEPPAIPFLDVPSHDGQPCKVVRVVADHGTNLFVKSVGRRKTKKTPSVAKKKGRRAGDWLKPPQIAQRLRSKNWPALSKAQKQKAIAAAVSFCCRWAARDSILRDGEKALRWREAESVSSVRAYKSTEYYFPDVVAIRSGQESLHPGRGGTDEKLRSDVLKKTLARAVACARKLLKDAGRPLLRSEVMQALEGEGFSRSMRTAAGLDPTFIRKEDRPTPTKAAPVWMRLPGQVFPWEAGGMEVTNKALALAAPDPVLKPRWDKEQSQLWFGSTLCKQYKKRPASQAVILDAFEREGWPARVEPRLSRSELRNTLHELRIALADAPIFLRADGTKKGILWGVKTPQIAEEN